MHQKVRRVMASRMELEELAIQHVRDRRQRVPIVRMKVRQRPDYAAEGETGSNERISDDIGRVVQCDELVPHGLSEHHDDTQNEQAADGNARTLAG